MARFLKYVWQFFNIMGERIKNERFLRAAQKHSFLQPLENIWQKYESVSAFCFLHYAFYIFFNDKLVYLIQQPTSFFLSHIFALNQVYFCVCFLACIPIIAYHSHLLVNFIRKHLIWQSRLIYEANLFNNNFDNFNKFLTILKCSVELDFEFNVTVDSYMSSSFYVVDFYKLLQFIRLNIFEPYLRAQA